MRKDFWMRECSCAGPAFEGQSRLGERESWSSILFRGGLRYQRDFKQLRLSNQPAISSWYRKIGPRDPLHFLPRFRFAWPCIASKSPFLPQLYTGEREEPSLSGRAHCTTGHALGCSNLFADGENCSSSFKPILFARPAERPALC